MSFVRSRTVLVCVATVLVIGGCSSSSPSQAASKLGGTVRLDAGPNDGSSLIEVPAGATRTAFDKIVTALAAKQSLADLFGTGEAINVGRCATATVVDTAIGGERQVKITDDPQFADNNGKTVWVDVQWLKSKCTTPEQAAQGATVSAACDQAMQAITAESSDVSDAQANTDDDASLVACASKAEWLAAAQKYRSSGIDHCVVCGNATADSVLKDFCSGSTDKPACKE
jgi:hypothetical protein